MTFNYFISLYEKKGDERLVKEIPILDPNLVELKELFNIEEDDDLCEMYPINLESSKYFIDKFQIEFKFDEFDYFFEVAL